LADDELDAAIFVRTVRELLTEPPTPTVEFVQRIRAALAQWRGPAFGGHARGHLGRSLVDHYRQARLSALDLLYDNELCLGRCPKVVEELSALIELEPFDERFCEQLMIGLYRSGRPADALAVYRRFRQRMVDELGVEPSLALRRRQLAVLQHDPRVSTRPDYLGRAGFGNARCQSRVSDPTVNARMLKGREKPQHQRGGNSRDGKPGRQSEGTKYATYI
jgi:hypothetical protein